MRSFLCVVIGILMDHYKIEPVGAMAWIGVFIGAFYAFLNDYKESRRK